MARKKNNEQFIKEATLVHGDKYDYTEVKYEKDGTKVNIICRLHGMFECSPNNHLKGKGCKNCGLIKRGENRTLKQKDVINEFLNVHGNFYDYEKFIYVKSSQKSIITCPKHGDFLQSHNVHRKGVGCPECGNIATKSKLAKTTEDFIKASNLIFNNKFSFDNSLYECRFCDISITCPQHGEFKTTPANHLTSKYGCDKCANSAVGEKAHGWSYSKWEDSAKTSENFDSFKVYILRCWDENEEFYKIGKTFTKIKSRYGRKKEMPYNYEVVKVLISKDAKYICELEERLKRESKLNKYLPDKEFGGRYECYSKIL